MALLGHNECFLSRPDSDEDDEDEGKSGRKKDGEKSRKKKGSIYCDSEKAKDKEFLKVIIFYIVLCYFLTYVSIETDVIRG